MTILYAFGVKCSPEHMSASKQRLRRAVLTVVHKILNQLVPLHASTARQRLAFNPASLLHENRPKIQHWKLQLLTYLPRSIGVFPRVLGGALQAVVALHDVNWLHLVFINWRWGYDYQAWALRLDTFMGAYGPEVLHVRLQRNVLLAAATLDTSIVGAEEDGLSFGQKSGRGGVWGHLPLGGLWPHRARA